MEFNFGFRGEGVLATGQRKPARHTASAVCACVCVCVRVCACVRVVGGWWDVHGPPLLQTHTARTKLNLRRIRYSAFGIRLPRDDSQGTGVPALSSGRTGVRLINKLNIAKDDDVTAHRVR